MNETGRMHPFTPDSGGIRCAVCEVWEPAHSTTPCACAGCGAHDHCRGMGEGKHAMCAWCEIEAKVEKRWAKMLASEGSPS